MHVPGAAMLRANSSTAKMCSRRSWQVLQISRYLERSSIANPIAELEFASQRYLVKMDRLHGNKIVMLNQLRICHTVTFLGHAPTLGQSTQYSLSLVRLSTN